MFAVNAKNELEHLQKKIHYHSDLYHRKATPEISDSEYDLLFDRLLELESQYPQLLTPDSPSQTVGAKTDSGFKTVLHKAPMLSLSKCVTDQELREFDTRVRKLLDTEQNVTYSCEPKIDGVAVSVVYVAGKLEYGVTRGDGKQGEDITANIRTIDAIPKVLTAPDLPDFLEVRGEVYMTKADFELFNKQAKAKNEKLMANPRNGVAGSLRQLNAEITRGRPLRIFAYAIGEVQGGIKIDTQENALLWLKSLAFPINDKIETASCIDAVCAYVKKIWALQDSLDYEIDGAVIKVNSLSQQQLIGHIARSPRYAIAYKTATQEALTKVLNIDFQVGRTGIVTPVAKLQPVSLGGVIISNATLHNWDEITRLDLYIGDQVWLQRAGGVIPKILRVAQHMEDSQKIILPSHCPACSGLLVKDDKRVAIRCSNGHSCLAQRVSSLLHFASRAALDIKHLGGKLAQQLIETGMVKMLGDLYRIEVEQLKSLARIGDKSGQNLINAIQGTRRPALARLIYALGIDDVGLVVAQNLASHFGEMAKFRQADIEVLKSIKDIGPNIAQSIVSYFADGDNSLMLDDLLRHVQPVYSVADAAVTDANNRQIFTGQKLVITGKFVAMTRAVMTEKIESLGGQVSSRVVADTAKLILGEIKDKSGTKKLQQATLLGIDIIDEKKLLQLLADGDR